MAEKRQAPEVDSSPEAIAATATRLRGYVTASRGIDCRDPDSLKHAAALLELVAAISEGRRQVLEAKSRELAAEWARAENAEARAESASRQLAEARAALTEAASTFRWYAALHHAKGTDPENVAKARRNEEEALKCERALLSGEPTK